MTYKILSVLLSYPEKEMKDLLPEVIPELIAEKLLKEDEIEGIRKFIAHFMKTDITDWQEYYVQLFDYSQVVSLNLFEHVHGDSKDRGQAMVDLIDYYNENGLELCQKELPDYLPAFMEFLSMQDPGIAAELLADPVEIIELILTRLKESESHYQYIIAAIISLSGKKMTISKQSKI
jgi:nitrate reductase delta subunit